MLAINSEWHPYFCIEQNLLPVYERISLRKITAVYHLYLSKV